MGNSSTKEARPTRSRPASIRNASVAEPPGPQRQSSSNSFVHGLYNPPGRAARTGSRSDLGFMFGSGDRDAQPHEQRRETKQEREARKLEKERIEREKERERSLKEEHVDGGYLVTLGTYTGPEDFNKPIVRQLQIERRLAPFWKGLNDHKDSWTEHQLVAAARGLPIPAPDEVPPELERTATDITDGPESPPSEAEVHKLTLPITSRSTSNQSDLSANLSASHPAFSSTSPVSPSGMGLFRGRARTLASLTSASRSGSAAQPALLEVQLPKDPCVNGQPIEAYLYKDAQECPICFMYYPPYLNKTRCCDQPICSECFVQIKRPDPHPPEHHEDSSNPNPPEQPKTEEDGQLVSEPSACPFCVTPEFGVTYEPPSFRRGLTYVGASSPHPLASATSAMSSSTSLGSMVSRRRTTSLSATDKSVITTDKVRPDWAKKLADARAHALRRSAAATALHNAAYVLGNTQNIDLRAFNLGRRRRLFGEGSSGGIGTPEGMGLGALFRQQDGQQSGDEGASTPQRGGAGRRSRVEDLEELMMMEAIRLSLAAEEERKKKEEKDAAKEAKKRAKQDAKDAKKAEKAAKKAEKAGSLYTASTNQSTSTWASTSMTRSTSNLGFTSGTSSPQIQGKGKAPAAGMLGFNPLNEPTSTLNRDAGGKSDDGIKSTDEAQRYLEESRANLSQPSQPIPLPNAGNGSQRGHHRQFSGASSIGSSMLESGTGSYKNESGFGTPPLATSAVESPGTKNSGSSTPQQGQASTVEPMFNFRSLAAMIGEEKEDHHAEHNENSDNVETPTVERKLEDTSSSSAQVIHGINGSDQEDSGESSSSAALKEAEALNGNLSSDKKPIHDVQVTSTIAE
ncbi:hypothetical protein K461DRAFT_321001 [Myriangium duriaei CBS 260.36]|uniref:Protein sip5 n=1 Tax=Myriangium duriaei CBS 260.36 TaxID=1168546 RepID=A0A9P4J6J5_9PEZI|nr:hypothetical protein K461DRAFT_321001 [Myriangium duriaei CBS 260.36]